MRILFFILTTSILFFHCKQESFNPKPRTFPRIFFPDKKYENVNLPSCPFSFEVPVYSKVEKDSTFFHERSKNDCWFNIQLPDFNGTIFCSYVSIVQRDTLAKCIRDSYKLANQHQQKANYVDEIPIHKKNKVSGIVFNLEGAVASPFQFYLTDSLHHFIRGSLYFNSRPHPDSIAPIADFIKTDIIHMMNTFEWK